MNLVDKIKKYREESGATCEQIAKAIGVDPVKFRCFMFGKGKLTGNQIMMLDLVVSAKLGESEEKEEEKVEEEAAV